MASYNSVLYNSAKYGIADIPLTLTDSSNLTENAPKQSYPVYTDTQSLNSAITLQPKVSLSAETITVLESILQDPGKTLGDSVTSGASLFVLENLMLSDSQALLEVFNRLFNSKREFNDSIPMGIVVSKQLMPAISDIVKVNTWLQLIKRPSEGVW